MSRSVCFSMLVPFSLAMVLSIGLAGCDEISHLGEDQRGADRKQADGNPSDPRPAAEKAPDPEPRPSGFARNGRISDEPRDSVAQALIEIGPAAEAAVGTVAPINDPHVCYIAIQILEKIGTEESLPLLRQATLSRNVEIRAEAKRAIAAIIGRRGAEHDSVNGGD